MKRYNFWNMILRSPEGEGGGAGVDQADAGSIMFPGDATGENKGVSEGQGADANDKNSGDSGAAEGWKEYENDPAKSDDENAAAKAEHDKTKPADDAGKGAADQVPEDGKYALTMPEGVELDSEMLEALGPDFKDLGLTNAQAQKLADKFISIQQGRGAKQTEAWGQTVQGWADSAKSDAEIGGTRWDDTVKTAVGFMGEFTSDAGKEFLNSSGAGNHPEMIRMARNAGKVVADLRAENANLKKQLTGEDNPAIGGAGGSSKPADAANILFPTDVKG